MNVEALKKRIKGIFVVQATPCTPNGEVDLEGLKENTRFLVDRMAGKDLTLVPVGSTGEFYALSDEDRKRVIRTVVEEVDGRVPVLAGTAQAATEETLKMSRYAEEVGTDGVQVVLPYYHVPNEEGMYAHFRTVAEGIGIGVMIYNNPAVSKCWIKPPLMARLSEIENIIADKENTPDVIQFDTMRRTVDPSRMMILCGLGEYMFSFEAACGCPGFVSWIANFAPLMSYELYEAACAVDFVRVRAIMERMMPLWRFTGEIGAAHGRTTGVLAAPYHGNHLYVSVMKAVMDLLGLCGGAPLLPLTPLTAEEQDRLREILVHMGLKVVQ